MRVLVVDAMGVLYEARDDLRELLIPFARARGTGRSDAEIVAAYRVARIGGLDAAGLWARLGVGGDPAALDQAYLDGHRAVAGMRELLRDVRGFGARVGCISNDLGEWSRILRERHGYDRLVEWWTISAEVRSAKPDPAIFDAFLATSALAADGCVFVDDRPANVAAAATLGFRTVLAAFGEPPLDGAARNVAELREALRAPLDAG